MLGLPSRGWGIDSWIGKGEVMADRENRENITSGDQEDKGQMTVSEAGHMGGQRVKELVEEGKEKEQEEGK